MAEVLMIRNLDEKAVNVIDLVKKKHQIKSNSKATLKIFDEYIRLLEKVEELERRNRKLNETIDTQNEILRSVKKTFDLVSTLK